MCLKRGPPQATAIVVGKKPLRTGHDQVEWVRWERDGVKADAGTDPVRVLQKQKLSAPPNITTWNWQAAKDSVAALAKLDPRVIAGGHGIPMTGPETARNLRAFANRFSGSGTSERGEARGAAARQRR